MNKDIVYVFLIRKHVVNICCFRVVVNYFKMREHLTDTAWMQAVQELTALKNIFFKDI